MRVEFFFKAQSELSALVNFMMAYQQSAALTTSKLPLIAPLITPQPLFSRFNLANKVKNDNLLASATNILNVMPSANVCIHYSLKYNSQKSIDQSFVSFNNFLSKAEKMGVAEILIISGSGDKKAFNTVSCLEMLRDSTNHDTPVDMAVAFNPYFPDPKMRIMEIERLKSKLSTGMVSTIYLQFGSDLNHLREGLTALQSALLSYEKSDKPKGMTPKVIKVCGSVMIPSKQLLARMKFRPWNGVFLSELFLSDVPAAEKIVLQILSIYKSFNIEPLVETAFKTDHDAAHILNLLSSGLALADTEIESSEIEKSDKIDASIDSASDLPSSKGSDLPKKRKNTSQ